MGMDRDSRTDHWQPDRLWQPNGGADKAKNVLDNTWIKKGKYGIPNTRNIHMNEKLWTFPYPKAFEILPNGHLRELSHEEAFINVL